MKQLRDIIPLSESRFDCSDCGGTGVDKKKTQIHQKKNGKDSGNIRCWTCNGNGLDPAEYFRWGDHPPLKSKNKG